MSLPYSFDDVHAHRQASQPLAMCIAPVLTLDMFKSARCFAKPISRDFTHLLSRESRSRLPATLKAAGIFLKADTISLGTGRPSAEYFPLNGMSLDFAQAPGFSATDGDKLLRIATGKYDMVEGHAALDLAVALNYGYSAGSEQLVRYLTEHIDVVHNPPYSNWQTALTIGNTSAIDGAFRMFCTRGDYVIVEEFTYSGAIEAMRPLGLRVASIKMDKHGLLPEHLDEMLSKWDEDVRGAKKPFLLYMIPTGQNPSGVTQTLQRRQQIYSIADKHDLYIIEDDPYYFLQLEQTKSVPTPKAAKFEDHTTFLQNLIPSYLSMDVSGRVLRLDSTSKLLAPGLRCGWMTGSSQLIERFLYHHDVSTVCPSGLSQLAMYNLLEESWGHGGFMNWLQFLRSEYSHRRDVLIQACTTYLPPTICSWNIPTSGMFHWIKIEWTAHPLVVNLARDLCSSDLLRVEDKIFETALSCGVVCCKGSTFRADEKGSAGMFFRTSFATATTSQLEEAIKRFGRAIAEEFHL